MLCNKYLRFATNQLHHVIDINQSNSEVHIIGGYEGEVVKLILQYFAPKHKILVPEDNEWGRINKNGSWTGLIGMLQRNEADFAISSVSVTEERSFAVDFSVPYVIEKYLFVTRAPGTLPRYISILSPFSKTLWIIILLTVLAIYIVVRLFFIKEVSFFKLFELLQMKATRLKLGESYGISKRVLCASILFALIILTFSYEGVLLTMLAIPESETGIRSIADLSKAVQTRSYKCYTFQGLSVMEMFSNTKDISVQNLGKAIQENKWFIPHTTTEVGNKIFHEKAAVIFVEEWFKLFHSESILMSDDVFDITPLSVAMTKRFPCAQKLNQVVYRLIECGIFQKFKTQYFFEHSVRNADREANMKLSLSIIDFKEVFLVLVCGYISSLVVFICEITQSKFKKLVLRMLPLRHIFRKVGELQDIP
ncbi:glutamate receptor ionotropic, kainate 5-like [Uloborus diversus]|uniref:glutamate receptor ionotropic, kainate 5-like n=1 Tax=Uloborus diversus TaxID=327109 RepID=UPI00240A0E82|nr:glutamate receptor ionotropic, kainate 5-like [Uloborus diversus]